MGSSKLKINLNFSTTARDRGVLDPIVDLIKDDIVNAVELLLLEAGAKGSWKLEVSLYRSVRK